MRTTHRKIRCFAAAAAVCFLLTGGVPAKSAELSGGIAAESTPLPNVALTEASEINSGFAERIQDIRFSDMLSLPADHWSKPAVYTMAAFGILKGDAGLFRPTGTTTRSEALAVFMRAAGLEKTAELAYKDMQNKKQKDPYKYNRVDEWADGYIRLAVDYGILSVDQYNAVMAVTYTTQPETRLFEKDGAVTRLEAAEWFVRIFKLPLAERIDQITDFKDYTTIPAEKRPYIETAVQAGVISGYGDTLGLDGAISRQEMAQILFNARDLLCEKNGYTAKTLTVTDSVTETVSATENGMVNRTSLLLSDGSRFTVTRTYALAGAAVDYSVYNPDDTDVLTIKAGSEPSGVNLLSRGDTAVFYTDPDGVLFLIVCGGNPTEQEPENIDTGYTEGPPVSGKLYLVDEENHLLVLEQNGEYIEVPYMEGLAVYWRNTPVSVSDLTLQYLDTNCMVFRVKKDSGTLYRAYRMQILK